ncbi:hypothetical protein L3556_06495 [Candidatus Synechococcus calcipolaris G9]|uniref:Uncharacterized protein n=1 Tax=Candidatus Synechococcus calcipolaris G9 TaxID=1497997 RepID=A0ABT6EXQ6_9SYNE|nr:hypothetical protein [Candidatus Synechococcus calcipolaris]MDG2990584.1 hypothetical protein [Candidatus Synechococcus calcipolaris G9]
MGQDEILDEIHKIREEHAKSFNYDLDAMFADWQKRQSEDGRKVVSLPPKRTLITRWSERTRDISGDAEDTSRRSI